MEAEAVLPKAARGPHQPATQLLHLIGKLYAAEVRERYSRMVLGKTKALLDEHLETTLPGGKLGQTLGLSGQPAESLHRERDLADMQQRP